jgi:hypothetical protein
MSGRELAHALIETLPRGRKGLFNPWRDQCQEDCSDNTPMAKEQRLAQHLDCQARFILCGEAAGYQGCRHSGIAFTSERLLLEGAIPRVPAPGSRLTHRLRPYSEPSATIVWRTLKSLGLEAQTLLWNALPLHPMKGHDSASNRTPSDEELRLGRPAMSLLLEHFPKAQVVAVGRKAESLLFEMGVPVAASVRHPANGGATEFARGLASLMG